jgi:hypothetical protein
MIPGIDDDPPLTTAPAPPTRPMVTISLGFYHYLQDCADLISAISTDDRRLGRALALEWKLGARAIQYTAGKLP